MATNAAATKWESRRPGTLGVHSIDHAHLAVPDLQEAARFYGSFGLDVRDAGGRLGIYTADNPHRWAAVTERKRKQLAHLSFGRFEGDSTRIKPRLERNRGALLKSPPWVESYCSAIPVSSD